MEQSASTPTPATAVRTGANDLPELPDSSESARSSPYNQSNHIVGRDLTGPCRVLEGVRIIAKSLEPHFSIISKLLEIMGAIIVESYVSAELLVVDRGEVGKRWIRQELKYLKGQHDQILNRPNNGQGESSESVKADGEFRRRQQAGHLMCSDPFKERLALQQLHDTHAVVTTTYIFDCLENRTVLSRKPQNDPVKEITMVGRVGGGRGRGRGRGRKKDRNLSPSDNYRFPISSSSISSRFDDWIVHLGHLDDKDEEEDEEKREEEEDDEEEEDEEEDEDKAQQLHEVSSHGVLDNSDSGDRGDDDFTHNTIAVPQLPKKGQGLTLLKKEKHVNRAPWKPEKCEKSPEQTESDSRGVERR